MPHKFDNKSAKDSYQFARSCPLNLIAQFRGNVGYIPDKFYKDQQDFDLALSIFKENLKVDDQERIDEEINAEEDEDMKQKLIKHYEKQNTTAIKEACLHHVGGVKEVAWIPANTQHPSFVDSETKCLLGKYVLKVWRLDLQDDRGIDAVPTFEVHPDLAWVKKTYNCIIWLQLKKQLLITMSKFNQKINAM